MGSRSGCLLVLFVLQLAASNVLADAQEDADIAFQEAYNSYTIAGAYYGLADQQYTQEIAAYNAALPGLTQAQIDACGPPKDEATYVLGEMLYYYGLVAPGLMSAGNDHYQAGNYAAAKAAYDSAAFQYDLIFADWQDFDAALMDWHMGYNMM